MRAMELTTKAIVRYSLLLIRIRTYHEGQDGYHFASHLLLRDLRNNAIDQLI